MNSSRLIYLVAAGVVVGLAAVYLSIVFGDGTPGRADADDRELVALGRSIYMAECASCHGETLEGQPNWRARRPDGAFPAPPHDETGHTWHHADPVLFDITKHGGAKNAPAGFVSAMPAFGDKLDDREIWAALAYIKSTWPDGVRARHAMINERWKQQTR